MPLCVDVLKGLLCTAEPAPTRMAGRLPLQLLTPRARLLSGHIERSFKRLYRPLPKATSVEVAQTTQVSDWNGFGELSLSSELQDALKELSIHEPTEIQARAIPKIRDRQDALVASHTGSGKTLAYLLPLVQNLKEQESQPSGITRPRRPRAVVLGPTRELTDQILSVAKALAHHAKFRSCVLNAGSKPSVQRKQLLAGQDVVIATPSGFLQHMDAGNVFVGDVRFLVLDEADTMFDRGFGDDVRRILSPCRSKPEPSCTVLVSATPGKGLRKMIREELPELETVQTSSINKGVAGAKHTFMPVPPGADKQELLAQLLERERPAGRKVMVFCNTQASCRSTEHFLAERDVATVAYHGEVSIAGRKQAMMEFVQPEGEQPVMVCTDLAARGLDMAGAVDLVVNFDMPLDPIDYLHRSGRTARAGNAGRITSLLQRKPDRVLAARIEWALQHGQSLDELSAAKGDAPASMRPKPQPKVDARRHLQGRGSKAGTTAGGRGLQMPRGRVSFKGVRGPARADMQQHRAGSESGGRGQGRGGGGGGGRGHGGRSSGRGRGRVR